MRSSSPSALVAALLATVLLLGSAPPPTPVRVASAASLTDALHELEAAFEAAHPDVDIVPILGSSSTLAHQLQSGADFDVYLTADLQWLDVLEAGGFLQAASRWTGVGNRLVIIGRPESLPPDLEGLRTLGRVAVADPDAVPAGRYTREALTSLGLWDDVEGRLVAAVDVRAALAYAERGEVDAAVVYATDAAVARRATGQIQIPDAAQPAIRYGAAATTSGGPEALAFVAFLGTEAALERFDALGFVRVPPTGASAQPAPPRPPTPPATDDDFAVIRLSLVVAFAATVLVVPFGILVAWLLARRRFWGRSVLEHLSNLPLVLPPAVTGFLLLWLFGRAGWLGGPVFRVTGLSIAFSTLAAILAAAVVAFPLMVQSVRVAIEAVDPELESAAATLGASPWRVFRSVTLPLALPGVAAGTVVTFARALGELGATLVFAGNIPGETRTIPLAVWTRVSQVGGEAGALRLVIVSVVIAYASVLAAAWFQRRVRSRAGDR